MKPSFVAKIAQLAAALEVSGYPKPGNVHRTQNFDDMSFEDFIISAIVIGDTMKEAAERGATLKGELDFSPLRIGNLMLKAVKETQKWVSTNTNLGIIMLLTPLASAAAMVTEKDLQGLREMVNKIMLQTTPQDAVDLYDAIAIAQPGGMGKKDQFDVNDEKSKDKILKEKVTLFDVLKLSSSWDLIARELTSSMPITFNIGFPAFKETHQETDMNTAIVQTFITILSNFPDTLIQRQHGKKIAEKVTNEAREVLDKGGMLTEQGLKALKSLDRKLQKKGINPGTTADLTASSIMVGLIDYYGDKIR
ncbi:MAG TPA: triphosphoribosyl-dephospho-CoA synthase [Methanothermobacter sp.]|nr:predicted ATP:dephospho-CoA triphosphoribosyl transferase [Methanothermobacter sp. MT-2]HHW05584.1 ATP--dephospho-CoA triphosphoribosyl transferase CitG [Methanothermobacter sp.]HOK72684.1 triphosphoribosyl-dephospho-CoA synthase [Methanothermobacter sp.]HOL68596.1 triphosphoribosyl-dephospho-CoA synthase [Methanothermobacter sp.]HPQ04355.1 triphosphoribosyl-dephospho-CoA synthase [Methanothermobacter sp.]